MDTARAAARFGVTQVNGFTGSSIWHLLYSFPPNDCAAIEAGYEDFAERWNPIIDVFDAEGVRFGLEVHPTEIAYDFVDHRSALDAIGRRARLRHQLRPEPLRPPVPRLGGVHRGVRRPHLPRARQGRQSRLDGRRRSSARTSTSATRDAAGTSSRRATATSTSRRSSGRSTGSATQGPLSVEWEDSGMDREWGAQDALAFVRRTDFPPSACAFDAGVRSGELRHGRARPGVR